MTVVLDLEISASYSSSQILRLLSPQLAEVREAGEPTSQSINTLLQLAAAQSHATSSLQDTWLADTLGYIQRCAKYQDGWDGAEGIAPTRDSLKSSEYLTAFFAEWSTSRRPRLGIDASGRPTFASKTKDFYLHLTVEGADKLTWYAVKGSQEHFQQDVPFDGTVLPPGLASLAA